MSLQRFTVKCCSDFNLYNRFLSGEDITPVLAQRASLGFNACRVWCAYDIPRIGRLNPSEHPDYFAQWPAFLQTIALYGLYAEVTVFTGPYPFFPTKESMIQFWDQLLGAIDVAELTNVLDIEAVNEWDNTPNLGVPLERLRRPTIQLSSHGSSTQDAPPPEPVWSVWGYRSPFTEWQRKTGHNAMEWANELRIPCWTNEFPRTDNDPDITHWYDAAAAGVLLCAGAGCFHSPEGKESTLFTGSTLACAVAFIAGADSVPLEFQAGAYARLPLPYPPGVLRIYRRTLSDGRFHEVRIRA